MRLRLSSWAERIRASLFFVPMTAVLAAVALGLIGVAVDEHLDRRAAALPLGLSSTVDSARVLLSTIAGATITFAGIAFSVSLLLIQQASSQYSPRVVHTLFRDPYNKRVMALVVGTFTYCVVVLRSVHSPLDPTGRPTIPNLSVAVAMVLGITTILAVVAFINHSAHSMDVSEILERVRREATAHIRREWTLAGPSEAEPSPIDVLDDTSVVIRFDRSGWVQQIDTAALLGLIPDGGVMRIDTCAGRYAIEGTPFCALSAPASIEETARREIRAAVAIGETRTMQQDTSYGLRQLADVALKALSPGINDPTTAQDAIFHSAAVLNELLLRDPPAPTCTGDNGQRLVLAEQRSRDDLVSVAFDETRRAAANQPAVCVYLLEALALLDESLRSAGLGYRSAPLRRQARLIIAGSAAAGLLPSDLEIVDRAYAKRFALP